MPICPTCPTCGTTLTTQDARPSTHPGTKPITIDGVTYPSQGAAARALNVSRQSISLRASKHAPMALPVRDLAAEGAARRESLYAALKAVPGASLRYLAQAVGLSTKSPASVAHHLQLLAAQGRVIQTAGRWRVKE